MMRHNEALPKTKTAPPARTCGFQFSWPDAGVVLVCGIVTVLLWPYLGQMSLLFPIALGHFFLFCNVFRIFRKYEYVWAAVFVLNFSMWLLLGCFSWGLVMVVQTPFTLTLIIFQMRSRWYYGVYARIINKSIETYLRGDEI